MNNITAPLIIYRYITRERGPRIGTRVRHDLVAAAAAAVSLTPLYYAVSYMVDKP